MKYRVLLIVLSALFVLAMLTSAETTGDPETAVTNRPAATSQVNTTPAPGDDNVVIQDVDVCDPGKDGFATEIETVTVRKAQGTLQDRYVVQLRLYRESGAATGFQPSGPSQDEQLDVVPSPNLSEGVTFGTPGVLLRSVANGKCERFYVVADFSRDTPNGATLRPSFDLTVADSLQFGSNTSSGLDPALKLPLLMEKGSIQSLRLASTSGADQTDVIDRTDPVTAKPGDSVVIQRFRIEDPGTLSKTGPDGNPTAIKDVTVTLAASTLAGPCNPAAPINPCAANAVKRLRLFRESQGSKPGFQDPERVKTGADELLGTVIDPDLKNGVIFSNGRGGPLILVKEGFPEIIYVVADFATTGLIDGQRLRTMASLTARDMTDSTGTLIKSSNIETPMPLMASNEVEVAVPPATLSIDNITLDLSSKIAKVCVGVKYVPKPGLSDLQIGPDSAITFNPQVIEVIQVRGVNGYQVDSQEVEPAGKIKFSASLKPGHTAVNEGCVVEVEVAATPDASPGSLTRLQVKDSSGILDKVEVFRTFDGADLVPDVESGSVFIKPLCGDVDGDGAVTINDARLLAKFILRLDADIDPDHLALADVAPPVGVVDASDVRFIAQAAAKLRTLTCEVEAPIPTNAASRVRAWASTALSRAAQGLSIARVYAVSSANGLEFKVAGAGVLETQVEIYSLSGAKLYAGLAPGNTLTVPAETLTNGVYIYIVRVQGANGQLVRLKTNKLVIIR